MGSEFFNKVQYGKETTKGTPVAAAQMFIGQMQAIKSDRKPVYPKEHFGVRAPAFRSVIHQRIYTNTLVTEHGAFQHLPLFHSSLKGGVTPVEQTASQGDYLWDLTPSMTATNDPDAFTIEMGDDNQGYETEYCMFERFRISGQVAQGIEASPVRLEGDFFGRQIQEASFTGSLSPRTLEPMNAKLARVYLDDGWSNVGNTELANLIRTFDIELLTGVHPKFAGSAVPTFNRHAEGEFGVLATIGVEGGSDAADIFAQHQGNDEAVLRLSIPGSQIGSGDTFDYTLDLFGSFEDASPITGSDRGDNLAQFILRGFADKANSFKMWDAHITTNHNTY